jgi:carbon-monoxide dehydrogenase large subunit
MPSVASSLHGGTVARPEDARYLRGRGRYVADLAPPGTLEVAIVRSQHAHARLRRVDASAALRLPGVAAVVVPDDVRALPELPILFRPEGQRQRGYPVLPADRVRYAGQPVAAVAAADRYLAEDAAALVVVDYEPLPTVVDVDDALAPGAPRLYEDWPDNLVAWRDAGRGDPDAAFRGAAVTVEATFDLPRQTASPLEGGAALASVDAATGELTLWVSTQAPHQYRTILAQVLGMDEAAIRVIVPDVGGGFGAKLHYYPEEVLVCLLALRLRRPVRWIADRREHYLSLVHARQQRVRARAGFDAQGRLVALEAHVRGDAGAHLHTKGVAPIFVTGLMLPGPYRLDAYRARVEVVVTNKVPFGAYRAFGMQQSTFVMERLMDMAAGRLGLDPAELRRRNLLRPDAFPYRSAGGFVYDSGDYPTLLERALALSGYAALRRAQAEARAAGRLIGIGLSAYTEYTAMGPSPLMGALGNLQGGYETAVVRVEPDGDATVLCGVVELGQGIRASLAQVAAGVLALPPERVTVVLGDTHRAPYSAYGTAASRGAVMGGGATLVAAGRVREKILRLAAHLLEAAVEDVELVDGVCRVRGSPRRALTLAQIAGEAYRGHRLPPGMEPGLEAQYTYTPANWVFPAGVHVAAVEVDRDLGTVAFLGYWIAHDCGPLIAPNLVEGQLHGALAQGVGAALLEELVYDEGGQLLSGTLMDYLLPTVRDVPSAAVAHLETPSPISPGGLKGMAEGGTIAAPAAVVNAIADALDGMAPGAGAEIAWYPVTPARLVALLAGRGAGRRARRGVPARPTANLVP